ncbi:MAG: hypothetical protein LBP50_07520, partial [Tannerella sp.]|nr:hypothetical protein [Tannerella sp.]
PLSGCIGQKQPEVTPLKVTPTEQSKQLSAYVSNAGTLYIPTPPDGVTSYTVYPSVEAYNRRLSLPAIIPMKCVDISGMKQVFINSITLMV